MTLINPQGDNVAFSCVSAVKLVGSKDTELFLKDLGGMGARLTGRNCKTYSKQRNIHASEL